MEWVMRNWFWILLFAVFIGMHLFGHGGAHGGHGGGKEGDEHGRDAGGLRSDGGHAKKGGGGCH